MKIKNPCEECLYYHKENNTCQSKKCATGGDGRVTIFDRLFCEPYKEERKEKSVMSLAEQIAVSLGIEEDDYEDQNHRDIH